MIYFFWKHQQFVQCEIHPGRPHVFTVIDSGGEELTGRYNSAAELEQRWAEVNKQLIREGWTGPFGRDARV